LQQRNIIYSLLRIASFIKQRPLDNRLGKDISEIIEFCFAAWEFINTIYKSDWDKLIINDKKMSFRQYMSSQFNKKPAKTLNPGKDKQIDISRIPSLISPRSSKSILVKLKYFKKT